MMTAYSLQTELKNPSKKLNITNITWRIYFFREDIFDVMSLTYSCHLPPSKCLFIFDIEHDHFKTKNEQAERFTASI